MPGYLHHAASFKDPAGFMFRVNGNYHRQVNLSYAEHYELLMHSGLYELLTKKKLLIPHVEVPENLTGSPDWYKTLLPGQLRFISYAYEWSFDQLKDAALLTLRIMLLAMKRGMVLKDATHFNVQFIDGAPVFIDTLSFEKYDSAKPWVAYRQFCECFLFPLYLGHYTDAGIQKILSNYLEGIPAELTSKLLPLRSRLNLGVWLHVLLQSRVKQSRSQQENQLGFDQKKLEQLLGHLESIIRRLTIHPAGAATWINYYSETILSKNYLEEKEKIFRDFISNIDFNEALDAGANDGYFSMILAEICPVVAIDADPNCINTLYDNLKKNQVTRLTPLCVDMTNPSPAIGLNNQERSSFTERTKAEMVTALALIHHLVLYHNIPLEAVGRYLQTITRKYLIIEWVPVTDPKARELIKNKSTHHRYDAGVFESCFEQYFTIEKKRAIPGTERVLYQMIKKNETGS